MDQKKKRMIALTAVLAGLLIALVIFAIFVMPDMLSEADGEETGESSSQTIHSGQEDESTEELDTQESTDGTEQEETTESTGEETTEEPTSGSQSGETTHSTESGGTTGTTAAGVSYPISLQNGALEITGLFQFSGINPDDGNQSGTDMGSITLVNCSDSYLEEAKIALKLSDGTVLNFLVTELPAGASVMAFSTDSRTLEDGVVCVSYSCDAQFDANLTAVSSKVTAHVEGTRITLTNVSGQKISKVVVYCRSPLGDEYFGGVTYQYVVNDLPANGTATIDAVDCILGIAEVVRIQAD